MAFRIETFYQLNRRLLIWGLLFLLVWLLRDFFGLIFLTFALAFIAQPLAQLAQQRLRLPRGPAIALVHVFFLLTVIGLITIVTPRVVREAGLMIRNLPQLEQRLIEMKNRIVRDSPALEDAIPGYLASTLSEGGPDRPVQTNFRAEYAQRLDGIRLSLGLTEEQVLARDDAPTTDTVLLSRLDTFERQRDEALIQTVLAQQLELLRGEMAPAVKLLYRASMTLLLALLFSFLISMDLARLSWELRSLRNSRVRDFYNQTAQPVVRFAYVVGRAIRAQALIAVTNTALTLLGLWVLGIPSLVMLAFVVFFCSFIPVLGVFLSTTPMVLVALNGGGFAAAGEVVALVIGIHLVEAYLLNPLIYGQHFKLNPVFVLIILFIGHHAFGVWGMILGVPVAYYLMHDVMGVPVWGESKLAPPERATRPLSTLPKTAAGPEAGDVPRGDAARVGSGNAAPPGKP